MGMQTRLPAWFRREQLQTRANRQLKDMPGSQQHLQALQLSSQNEAICDKTFVQFFEKVH
jgi:hypothetical protein